MICTPSNNPQYTKRTYYGGLFNLQVVPSHENNYASYMSFNLSKLDCFLAIFQVFFKLDESKVYMTKRNSIQCYIIFSMIDFSSYIIEICVTSHSNILFAWESFIYTSRKALNNWTWFCKTIPMISTTL
jgi:hypothetical protein